MFTDQPEDKNTPLEYGELVGGPLDGNVVFSLGLVYAVYDVPFVNKWQAVYQRTSRMSSCGPDVWCYDYVGRYDNPEVAKLVNAK